MVLLRYGLSRGVEFEGVGAVRSMEVWKAGDV
jgi:hypothetical protein